VINFRYHVVSLTAVFLALAVGLVLGSAALASASGGGSGDGTALCAANQRYREQVRQLSAQAAKRDDVDRQLAPRTLAGTLTDRSVLLVSLPGAPAAQVRGTGQMLRYAGATVTGAVRLTGTFTDPANADALGELASTRLPVDIHQTLPDNGDGVESAAALLAAVLMTGTDGKDDVSASSRTTVLTAYATGHNIVVDQAVTAPAQAAVLVAGPPATGSGAADRNAAALTVVRQFARAGQAVLAGSGTAGAGNVVAAARRDSRLSSTVSTVDTLDRVPGRITAALAVAAQFAGTVGQYGVGSGATALLPSGDQ
jgi:copper transport outer membrane protein MctB